MSARSVSRLCVGLVVLALPLLACITTIQVNEVGVVMDNLTGELSDPIGPGSHLVNPFSQQVTIYSTSLQEFTLCEDCGGDQSSPHDAVEALTSDGEEVLIDITILLLIDPEQVNLIHTRWRMDYVPNFIRPTVRSIVRDVTAQYPVDTIWNVGRLDFEADIEERLAASFAEEGFILVDALIRDMTFTESYRATLESSILAAQRADQVATAAFIATAEYLILTVPAQMTATATP